MWDSMMGWGWHGGWGAGFGLMHLLWWVLVPVGIVLLIRLLMPSRRLPAGGRALEILRERYARGEIDKTEYEQRRRDLSG